MPGATSVGQTYAVRASVCTESATRTADVGPRRAAACKSFGAACAAVSAGGRQSAAAKGELGRTSRPDVLKRRKPL